MNENTHKCRSPRNSHRHQSSSEKQCSWLQSFVAGKSLLLFDMTSLTHRKLYLKLAVYIKYSKALLLQNMYFDGYYSKDWLNKYKLGHNM